MSQLEKSAHASSTPSYGGRLDLWAQTLGRLSGILCGLLILAIVATTVWACSIRDGDTGGAMGAGLTFVVLLPLAAIPVGLVCLVGAIVSIGAMRRDSSAEARCGLWLSLGGPVAVVLCYAACWGIMVAAGV